MAKGKKSPNENSKENSKDKEIPNEASSSVRSVGAEKKKKPSSSSSFSSRANPLAQPPLPLPIKSAPPSTNTPLTLLKRKSSGENAGDAIMGKNGEHKSDSESEIASQSSEEVVISTELPVSKGNKKNVQARLDSSPGDTNTEIGDAVMQVEETRQEKRW
jgi:hypothetical protein